VDGALSSYGEEDICVERSGEKPRRKEILGRPRCRWEDNIKMSLKEN